jgi:glycosyltransferase involved in cell wall biosynthesis
MIIGIDTRIPTKNKTGVGYLLDNIIPSLLENDEVNNYKLIGSGFDINKNNIKFFSYPKIIQRGINFFWKTIFFPPINFLVGKTDIFFFTNFVDMPVIAKKKVLLIPDMSFRKYPQFTERKNLRYLNNNVGKAIGRTDRIITISENAKKEICGYYKVNEGKVDVVYLGCPKNIKKVEDIDLIEETKKKYGIEKKYILVVGTLEPRKNIKGLIEAYNLLDDETKQKYQLVICGGKGWYYKEVFDIVKEYQLTNQIVFTGYADECDIPSIYSGASLFVYPSFYEGFGLPILEAFTCGIPVVCSDTSSLPEVAGEAVVYFDPENVISIKEKIKEVLNNKDLQKELVEKGFDQLKKFSWEESVKKIFNILIS